MLTVWGRRNAFNVQKVMWLVDARARASARAGRRAVRRTRHARVSRNEPARTHTRDRRWRHVRLGIAQHPALPRRALRTPRLLARRPAEQSRADRWMDWSQTTLQPTFLNGVFRGYFRTPPEQRDTVRVEQSIAQCAQHFQALDAALAARRFSRATRSRSPTSRPARTCIATSNSTSHDRTSRTCKRGTSG